MLTVDLNCDLGEGCENDAELMRYISSANVACGFHAGDEATMRKTVELAIENNVAVGAHPGYRDKENFGRQPMPISGREVFDIVVEQIELLNEICVSLGTSLHHVKPHGALYNQAARDQELAAAIAEAVIRADKNLILYGLSGSYLISEAASAGLRTASEVFADRTYQSDGSLTPRTEPNALIADAKDSVQQVLQMIKSQSVATVEGEPVAIHADTVCIHGDGSHATEFAITLRQELEKNGIAIQAV